MACSVSHSHGTSPLVRYLMFRGLVYNTYLVSIADSECDSDIDPSNTEQYVVWGVGGLGETAFKHFLRASSELI